MKCEYEGFECDCEGEVKARHRNTAFHYSEEERKAGVPDPNMMTSCAAHYQLDYDRYQDMWDDYYRSRF